MHRAYDVPKPVILAYIQLKARTCITVACKHIPRHQQSSSMIRQRFAPFGSLQTAMFRSLVFKAISSGGLKTSYGIYRRFGAG